MSRYSDRSIYGRRYHSVAEGTADHLQPNDVDANGFLDLLHRSFKITIANRALGVPLDRPTRALDVGCGTRLWAIEFAKQYPKCTVYATDISQTQHSDRPPNLRILEQDFIESEWLFADNWFDIVHMQCLKESIPNWVTVFKQAERVLKLGGFLEVIEHTSQIYPKGGTVENLYPELYDLGGMLRNVGIRIGRSMSVVEEERLIPALQEAGFQIMRNAIIPCSLTPPAQQGRAYDAAVFAQAAFLIDLKGYLLRPFVEALAWRPEWVVHYAQEIIKELRVVGQGDVTDLHIFIQHIISQKVYTQNKSRPTCPPKAMAYELKA